MNTSKEISAIFDSRKKSKILNRKHLIDTLKELLSDEFDAQEIMYLELDELVDQVINAAFYYKDSQTEEA